MKRLIIAALASGLTSWGQTPIVTPDSTGARVFVGNSANSAVQVVCINPTTHIAESCAGSGGGGGGSVTQGTVPWVTDGSAYTQPISAAALPLPTGASTSALQTTGNTSLSSIDGKVPALGQALAAASVPVVLTAAQLTTLTPLSTVTANQGGAPWSVSGSGSFTVVNGGTFAVQAAQSGTWTVQPGNTANTTPWLATINQGGNSATVSVGGALKVDGSAVTQPVSGTFWQATQPISASSLPLPTGASTLAEQQTQTTALQLLDDTVATTASAITSKGFAASGTDGTNARILKTDTSGELQIDVLTMPTTAVSQSGTWTVQPGNTANTTAWLVTGTGGTFPATQSGNWTARIVGNGGAVLDAVNTAATAPASGLLGLGIYNSTEPSPTTGQSVGIQLDAKGRQRQVIMDAAGNTRGANVDANSNLGVVLPAETTKVLGTIRVQGNVGGVLDAANNASAPANVIAIGLEAATQGTTQPTAATAGNVRRAVISTDGALYVRQGGPVNFTCYADNIAASLTQLTNCGGAGAGLKYYITDIVAQSTTTTAGQFLLRTGTGTNCGTGTASIFPAAATVVRYAAPANTAAATSINFTTPVATAANVQICVLGVATNTVTIQVNGYSAP